MYALLKTIEFCIGSLPLPIALQLGKGAGVLFRWAAPGRRRRAEENLRTCFPDWNESRIRTCVLGMYRNIGVSMFEQFWYCQRGIDTLASRIGGVEKIRAQFAQALQNDRGLLLCTAHMGNFELFGGVGASIGLPVSVVVKRIRPPSVEHYWNEARNRLQVGVFYVREAFTSAMRFLRRNGVLAMIMDQNQTREDGDFVQFFNRPACTTLGLALMSAQGKTPVLPAFLIRKGLCDHEIITYPLIEPPPDRKLETLIAYTQRYTDVIEDIIRRYPDEWIWMHRRWRTQPQPPGPTNDGDFTSANPA